MSSTSEEFPTLSSVKDSLETLTREGSPQLIVVMDCEAPLELSTAIPLRGVAAVEFGRGSTRKISGQAICDVRLADRFMSTRHARLSVQGQRFVLEDLGSKNGTIVNGKRLPTHVLQDGDFIELGHTILIFRDNLAPCVSEEEADVAGLATFSPEFAHRRDRLKALAPSPVSVLVRGETGTGKEVMARCVHQLSGATGAFVAVNCGALPGGLLESELFGYRRGSFSGAMKDHQGLVRAAEGGTLFLDEIGDLPLPAQAALLRVLQEREVLPIGEVKPVKVDFRLISATHRDLETLVTTGDFRQDLYARISGFILDLPPLRQRREDLGLLVRAILRRVAGAGAGAARFGTDAALAMYRYDWPLNIRELEKYLEAALVLAGSGQIRASHFPDIVQKSNAERERTPSAATAVAKSLPASLPPQPLSAEDTQRKAELEALLREHRGNVTAVANAMGKARVQIRRWMKRYGLSREE